MVEHRCHGGCGAACELNDFQIYIARSQRWRGVFVCKVLYNMLASWVSNKASNWTNTNDSPVAVGRKWADVQKKVVQRITSKIRDMIPVDTLRAVWEQVWDRERQEKRKTYTIQNSTLKCWLIMCTNAGKVVSLPTITSRLDVLNQVQQKKQRWFLAWGASSLIFSFCLFLFLCRLLKRNYYHSDLPFLWEWAQTYRFVISFKGGSSFRWRIYI